jgi:hypothetical protein
VAANKIAREWSTFGIASWSKLLGLKLFIPAWGDGGTENTQNPAAACNPTPDGQLGHFHRHYRDLLTVKTVIWRLLAMSSRSCEVSESASALSAGVDATSNYRRRRFRHSDLGKNSRCFFHPGGFTEEPEAWIYSAEVS